LSAWHFQRVFKATTGVSPKQYAKAWRAERARAALAAAGTVTEAIYEAGFSSSGRFYEQSGAMLGMTPSAFRARGAGETIRFAIGASRLGAILVARSGKGICAISLGDDPEVLLRGLQDQYPAAELAGADAAFEQWVAVVVGFVEAPGLGLDLPLDIRGTAFQQRVWQALRAIPPGQRVSYADVAARIGAPKAIRAVASACAANALAVAIPCHRVVRMDGGLGGYRWGIERKRELLAAEGA
jgi:AraC family transcriptional regulator of adaptative response/methylated-DNA-[protein]-cysteine methyltransferase